MGKIWDLVFEVMGCVAQRTVYLEVKALLRPVLVIKIIWRGLFSVELKVLEINF